MRKISLFVYACFVFAAAQWSYAQFPDAAARRGNVWYTIRAEYSRLALHFSGDVRHSEEFDGRRLVVHLQGIGSSVTEKGSQNAFEHGLIAQATLDKIDNGSTTLTLVLRDGHGTYAVTAAPNREQVWVDIFPGATTPKIAATPGAPLRRRSHQSARLSTTVPADAKEKIATPSSPHRTLMVTRATNVRPPLVDIAALIRRQIDDDESGNAAVSLQQNRGIAPANGTGGMSSLRLAIPTAAQWLVLAAIGVASVLAIAAGSRSLRKRLSRKAPNKLPAENTQTRVPAPGTFGIGTQPKIVGRDVPAFTAGIGERIPVLEEEENAEDAATAVAEQYGRNRGEIELAMKLQTQSESPLRFADIKSLALRAKQPAMRVRLAKKLGVGSGEMELASKLRRLASAHSGKEKE